MKKVFWLSRHTMVDDQLADLERVCGDEIMIRQWTDTIHSISEVTDEIDRADVIAAVLNVELLAELKKAVGSKPLLQAKSGRIPTGRVLTTADGRQEREFAFKHLYWEQIDRLELETRRL